MPPKAAKAKAKAAAKPSNSTLRPDATKPREPCSWGMRFAVPLEAPNGEWRASIDDVRTMVQHVHKQLNVQFPDDDYFISLLGTGKLAGKVSKAWEKKGLAGLVVILGCAKIREPHINALRYGPQTDNALVRKLCQSIIEISNDQAVEDCTDVLDEEVRGGTFYWFSKDFGGTQREHYETIVQEHRAWAHIGATRYDASTDIVNAEKEMREMSEKHGDADPAKWKWGAGTPCSDVFEAGEAKRKYEELSAKVAVFTAFRDESGARSTQSASRAGDKQETHGPRERSRSPRAPSGADRYMKDSQEFFKAYKKRGGKCSFDAFTALLRAFYEHTLNSHVWGENSEISQKNDNGLWLHPSRDAAEAAWAEQTGQTPQEFCRVFYVLDSVHAYT